MEAKWYKGSLVHQAGALRNRWACHECGGIKCEIMLALNDEPEFCLREAMDEEPDPDEMLGV